MYLFKHGGGLNRTRILFFWRFTRPSRLGSCTSASSTQPDTVGGMAEGFTNTVLRTGNRRQSRQESRMASRAEKKMTRSGHPGQTTRSPLRVHTAYPVLQVNGAALGALCASVGVWQRDATFVGPCKEPAAITVHCSS